MEETKTTVRKLTVELMGEDAERLDAICGARRGSGVYALRACSASQVVRDGLELVYLHEIMGESIGNGSDPAI